MAGTLKEGIAEADHATRRDALEQLIYDIRSPNKMITTPLSSHADLRMSRKESGLSLPTTLRTVVTMNQSPAPHASKF